MRENTCKRKESCVAFQELDLTRRQGKQDKQLLQLIDQGKTQALFSAQELVRLSHMCRDPPFAHVPAAKAALAAALQLMRSQPQQLPPMESMASVSLCSMPCCMHCRNHKELQQM